MSPNIHQNQIKYMELIFVSWMQKQIIKKIGEDSLLGYSITNVRVKLLKKIKKRPTS